MELIVSCLRRLHFVSFLQQELSKKQQQLEQAHGMLIKHHEKTQDLEYRQQKSVHALREEQVGTLHIFNRSMYYSDYFCIG